MATQGGILVIAAEAAEREDLSRWLGELGYEVASAAQGEAALELAAREQPRAILLSSTLPGGDALALCRELKAVAASWQGRVLALVELGDLGDLAKVVDAGADDFLGKPAERDELGRRLANLLRQ